MLFFAGEAEASAEVDVDFLVELAVELFLVPVEAVPWVVAVVEVALVDSSFFAHEPTNAAIVSAVIKAKRDVFIVVG